MILYHLWKWLDVSVLVILLSLTLNFEAFQPNIALNFELGLFFKKNLSFVRA